MSQKQRQQITAQPTMIRAVSVRHEPASQFTEQVKNCYLIGIHPPSVHNHSFATSL